MDKPLGKRIEGRGRHLDDPIFTLQKLLGPTVSVNISPHNLNI